MVHFGENRQKLIFALFLCQHKFSRFSFKVSILEYMLLNNSNINVAIAVILLG
jgi:hypothetical protein